MDKNRYKAWKSRLILIKGKLMATIYTKIYEYNKETQSLVVSFASTETKSQDPEAYEKLSFDIANLVEEGASQEELKTALSKSGEDWCASQVKKETLDNNTTKQTEVESLVETTWSKTTEELAPPPPEAKLDLNQLKALIEEQIEEAN